MQCFHVAASAKQLPPVGDLGQSLQDSCVTNRKQRRLKLSSEQLQSFRFSRSALACLGEGSLAQCWISKKRSFLDAETLGEDLSGKGCAVFRLLKALPNKWLQYYFSIHLYINSTFHALASTTMLNRNCSK